MSKPTNADRASSRNTNSSNLPHAPKVLFVGPLPPPMSGMPAVNDQMVKMIGRHGEITIHDTLPDYSRRSPRHIFAKGKLIVSAIIQVFRHRLRGGKVLYASVDDGWGILGTMAILAASRVCRFSIVLHHHSFKYIVRRSTAMSTLVSIAGQHTHHVLLCNCMAAGFVDRYPKASRRIVVPNAVEECAPLEVDQVAPPREVTIGLLSNLSFEKGLLEFISIAEERKDIRAILAGPAASPEVESTIRDALYRLGGRLEWLGPIHGQSKEAFFKRLDLFVFPTRYRTEAYPLVLLEALIRGVPVAARDRGCISSLSHLKSASIVPSNDRFTQVVSARIQDLIPPDARQHSRLLAASEGRFLNATNRDAMECLAKLVADL